MQSPANTPPAPMGPVSPQPSIPPQVPTSEPSSGDSNKMILWLLLGLVIVAFLVAGIYLFLSKKQAIQQSQTIPSQTPASVSQENLENELNSIDVEREIDSDFASVDQDLGQL